MYVALAAASRTTVSPLSTAARCWSVSSIMAASTPIVTSARRDGKPVPTASLPRIGPLAAPVQLQVGQERFPGGARPRGGERHRGHRDVGAEDDLEALAVGN